MSDTSSTRSATTYRARHRWRLRQTWFWPTGCASRLIGSKIDEFVSAADAT